MVFGIICQFWLNAISSEKMNAFPVNIHWRPDSKVFQPVAESGFVTSNLSRASRIQGYFLTKYFSGNLHYLINDWKSDGTPRYGGDAQC